jgi:hypothetical protein
MPEPKKIIGNGEGCCRSGKSFPYPSLRSNPFPSRDPAHPLLDPLQESLAIAIAGNARS